MEEYLTADFAAHPRCSHILNIHLQDNAMMKAVYVKEMSALKTLIKDLDRNAGDLQVAHDQLVTKVNKMKKWSAGPESKEDGGKEEVGARKLGEEERGESAIGRGVIGRGWGTVGKSSCEEAAWASELLQKAYQLGLGLWEVLGRCNG
jgi:hypothetical protein